MYSPGVEEWLQNVCYENQSKPLELQKGDLKRSASFMEQYEQTTPRPKKPRVVGLVTPVTSDGAAISIDLPHENETESIHSSQAASSRSSSPNKRQRAAELEFSIPSFQFLSRVEKVRWKSQHIGGTPCLAELLDCVSTGAKSLPTTTDIQSSILEIIEGVAECQDRDATEETWSDEVVLPLLKLAQQLSGYKDHVKVINVKSIDIYPKSLLPTNVQSSWSPRKRIDYTVGLEVTESMKSFDLLQSTVGHTWAQSNHKQLRDRAQCAHVEIKAEGGTIDARSQLSVWCAAGFRKQEELWASTQTDVSSVRIPKLAPVALWFWQAERVQLWIAVKDSEKQRVFIWSEKEFLITENPQSVYELVSTMAQIMGWGFEHYLPWFRKLIGQGHLNLQQDTSN